MSLEIQLSHPVIVVEAHIREPRLHLLWHTREGGGATTPKQVFERVAGVAVPGRVNEEAAHGGEADGEAVRVAHADEAEEGDYQGGGRNGGVWEEGLVELAADD